MKGNISFFSELIVDNFAGGGGTSTGIELATGRIVDIAINHDPAAIRMHRTNHPYTKHYQESVWDIDPRKVCEGHPVGLAWFSPDCKHFSKAKGGKPVEKKIRGLAWVVMRWAGLVRPRVIILENVEEFQTWGPVRRGKPVKSRKGETFQKFVAQLRSLDYDVEWRELVAADYGAPTTRKRFFLIARCDGQPIRWPKPTHAPRDSKAVKSGKLKPWRSAAEIIDWMLPCPSIFDSREKIKDKYGLNAIRPLKPNTMRRIIRGVDKFTIKSGNPFIVQCNHTGAGHIKRIDDPLGTILTHHTEGVATPRLVEIRQLKGGDNVRSVQEPAAKTEDGIQAASLIQYHTEQCGYVRASELRDPLNTIDASNRYGLSTAYLVEYFGNGKPLDISGPVHTITARDREALATVRICKYQTMLPNPTAENPEEQSKVEVATAKCHPTRDMGYWPEIRKLLNKYCGYSLGEDEVILLCLNGVWYFIADIGLRMLTPRELYAANGFPPDYIIDRDYLGSRYVKSDQVARCGNAVPPPFAAALVRANFPEWCKQPVLETMHQLQDAVAY